MSYLPSLMQIFNSFRKKKILLKPPEKLKITSNSFTKKKIKNYTTSAHSRSDKKCEYKNLNVGIRENMDGKLERTLSLVLLFVQLLKSNQKQFRKQSQLVF